MSQPTATPPAAPGSAPYRRPPSAMWWLTNRNYLLAFLRELSAIPIGIAVLLQLYLVYQIGQGPQGFASAVALLRHPGVIAFHVVTLAFVVLHLMTWFVLNARIMEIRTGLTALPPMVMIVAEYIALAVISAGIASVLLA